MRSTDDARLNRLCELNALAQARHVCETTGIQDAWTRMQPVTVHAVIYGLRDGRLRDLGFSTRQNVTDNEPPNRPGVAIGETTTFRRTSPVTE